VDLTVMTCEIGTFSTDTSPSQGGRVVMFQFGCVYFSVPGVTGMNLSPSDELNHALA